MNDHQLENALGEIGDCYHQYHSELIFISERYRAGLINYSEKWDKEHISQNSFIKNIILIFDSLDYINQIYFYFTIEKQYNAISGIILSLMSDEQNSVISLME